MQVKLRLERLAEVRYMHMHLTCRHHSLPLQESNIGCRSKPPNMAVSRIGVSHQAEVEMAVISAERAAPVGISYTDLRPGMPPLPCWVPFLTYPRQLIHLLLRICRLPRKRRPI